MIRMGRYALFALLAAAYFALLYHASVSREHLWLSLLLALAPLVVLVLFAAWGSSYRYPMLALVVIGTGTLGLLLGELIVRNYMWFYLIQHAGYNAGLAILFGRTLIGGQTALVTRFAAIVHDEMPPELIRYTRQVTFAWTLFFSGVTLISIGLFIFAPVEDWSLFANILYMPLLTLMFISEYLVRLRLLPHIRHVGLIDTLRSSSRYFREKP